MNDLLTQIDAYFAAEAALVEMRRVLTERIRATGHYFDDEIDIRDFRSRRWGIVPRPTSKEVPFYYLEGVYIEGDNGPYHEGRYDPDLVIPVGDGVTGHLESDGVHGSLTLFSDARRDDRWAIGAAEDDAEDYLKPPNAVTLY